MNSFAPKFGPGIRKLYFHLVLGLAVLLLLAFEQTPAQQGPNRVSYDVEFSTTGNMMARDGQCTNGAGYDILTGTISGIEPPPPDDDYVYEGKLTRKTKITFCYTATDNDGNSRACTANVSGEAEAWFELKLGVGGRGGYLKLLDDKPVKVIASSVTGTCDAAEMAEWQSDYGSMVTAGSPNGQPINVVTMPRIGPFPKKFEPLPRRKQPGPQNKAPGPSEGEAGIWTLIVRGWK